MIDNGMLGKVQMLLRGIEVTDETLSHGAIREAVYGRGHHIGQAAGGDTPSGKMRNERRERS